MVLDDGQSYTLDESANVGSLMEGSHVNLSCESAGTGCMVVEPGNSDAAGPEGQSETPTESEPTDGTTQQ